MSQPQDESTPRIFKTKWFARFARGEGIRDAALCAAIEEAARGLVDADLGGGVIKQRIARPGAGKSGGFRTIVLFRVGANAFFVYGFAKSQRDNISAAELADFRDLARLFESYSSDQLRIAVQKQELTEVICDEEEV